MNIKSSNLFSGLSKEDAPSNINNQINPSIFDFEDFKDLLKVLDNVSYESKLGKNLKNTLRKFYKEELVDELKSCVDFYYSNFEKLVNYKFRIKSLNSILIKYDKYYPSKEVKSCFNDVLGFRVLVPSLDFIVEHLNSLDASKLRVVDMRLGKSKDDGYRAVHLYYQKSNYHYPIEVQFWNKVDYDFHNWLHKYSYKYLDGNEGVLLRDLFDECLINNEEDFLNYLNLILEEKF